MKKYFLIIMIFQSLISCTQNTNKKDITKSEYLASNLVIKNVAVINMVTNKAIKNQDVIVKAGKIISIANAQEQDYKKMVVIDGNGKYMMPSLTDAHVHLPKNESDLERFFILNLINGVTKVRSMRGDWKHLEWREKYNTETSVYPKLYLSAPAISRRDDFSSEELQEFIENARDFDFVKILSIKNETLFKMLDSLCEVNEIKIGGHFPSNLTDAQIFKSSYASFEHLGGLTGQSELLENRLQEIKKKTIFICPTLSWYSVGSGRYSYEELRTQPGMQYVSKEMVNSWIEKTKQYRDKLGAKAYKEEVNIELGKLDEKYHIIKKLNELGVNMLLSPDSSSKYMVAGFGVVGEMELLKNAELSNFEILKMATVNFSDFFKEDYGTIEAGKEADFILLNDNPLENINTLKTIEGVFFNENYLSKDALNKLSESILPN